MYVCLYLSVSTSHILSFCPSVCFSVCLYPSLAPISLLAFILSLFIHGICFAPIDSLSLLFLLLQIPMKFYDEKRERATHPTGFPLEGSSSERFLPTIIKFLFDREAISMNPVYPSLTQTVKQSVSHSDN